MNLVNMENMPDYEAEAPSVHEVNMQAKNLVKLCEVLGIPIFIAYYLVDKGYKYKALLPEEIENADVSSEYGKFAKFLRVVMDFNKEDYITKIN